MTTKPERDPGRYCETLAKLMAEHDVSQARLARATGMHRSGVHLYVHGKRRPTIETMERLDRGFLGILHQRAHIRRRPR